MTFWRALGSRSFWSTSSSRAKSDASLSDANLSDAADAGPSDTDLSDASPSDARDAGPSDASDAGPVDADTSDTVDVGPSDVADVETSDAGDVAAAEDADASDAAEDADADEDSGECIPQPPVCGPKECSTLYDGCGNQTVCQHCPACPGGERRVESCGVCELGLSTCITGAEGMGPCSEPATDAISSETCASLIYVDPGADVEGDGAKDSPFKTYLAARDKAVGMASPPVIILGNSQAFHEPLVVANGVSVIGGFNAGNGFLWDASRPTQFVVPAKTAKDVVGLEAKNITQETEIAYVHINTADADTGMNNYGVYVLSSPGLSLKSVEVRSGSRSPRPQR